MPSLYIIKLIQNKYYIGKTNKLEKRLIEHTENKGSKWTSIYYPINLIQIIPNCDKYDEDMYTEIYMEKYGIENVRGGTYAQAKLDCLAQYFILYKLPRITISNNKKLPLYVLRLKNNKFLIERTNNIADRLQEHFDNKGTQWTQKYKPLQVVKRIDNPVDSFVESKITEMYMCKHGIDNVRGGVYTAMILDPKIKAFLVRKCLSFRDCCFNCNKKGHFSKNCPKENRNSKYRYSRRKRNVLRSNVQSYNRLFHRRDTNYKRTVEVIKLGYDD